MAYPILAEMAASISELKKNPMKTVQAGRGNAVAILNHNMPAFYCVPADIYTSMLERLEDAELNAIAEERQGEEIIKVKLSDL